MRHLHYGTGYGKVLVNKNDMSYFFLLVGGRGSVSPHSHHRREYIYISDEVVQTYEIHMPELPAEIWNAITSYLPTTRVRATCGRLHALGPPYLCTSSARYDARERTSAARSTMRIAACAARPWSPASIARSAGVRAT